MILIISHKQDFTADYVVNKLNKQNIDYYRFNTEDLFQEKILFRYNGHKFDTIIGGNHNIKSVWFRRIKLPDFSDIDVTEGEFIRNEVHSFFTNLWSILGCNWVSIPKNVYEAENKLLQLKTARKLGFNIPNTLVTTDADEIKSFYHQNSKNIIIKSLSDNYVIQNGREKVIFTNKLKQNYIDKIYDYLNLPSIFQEYIEKKIEIRVTVVADKVFSAYVESQDNRKTKIDWRREKLKFKSFKLPREISDKCVNLISEFNLSFGAIDLILTPENEFYFLELNPNGQWAWIEFDTDQSISDSLIEILKRSN